MMAGWSMPSDGSALDCKEMAEVLRRRGCKVGPGWEGFDLGDDGIVFSEVLSVLGGSRPPAPPAVLADGRRVDLPWLYRAVMGLGGYWAVGEGGLWGEVGLEVGLGGGAGPALKLLYAKYLMVLEEWARRNGRPEGVENGVHGGENGGSCLQSKRKREEHGVVEANGAGLKEMLEWVCGLAVDPCTPAVGDVISQGLREEMPLFVYWQQAIRAREVLTSSRPGFLRTDQSLLQKRLRAHPSMYEEFFGNGQEGTRWSSRVCPQNKTENKPSVLAYCSDASPSLENELSPSSMARRLLRTTMLSVCKDRYQKRVPIGPTFQAEVPFWEGPVPESESDVSRWLGEEQWSLDVNHRDVDVEHLGKGRPDSCGCRLQGSVECVRFHVAEKRFLLKRELGPVFYTWKFDKMGEEISLFWTEEEENRFKELVRLNPPSQTSSFWVPIYRSFPFRTRQSLVSYYFNVFLQRRRSYQNRVTPKNIDSDDDDSDFVFIGGRLGREQLSGCWSEPIYCIQNRQCDPLAVID